MNTTAGNELTVGYLADHLQVIPELVALFENAWEPYYGPGGPGHAEKDLRESANRDVLPIARVAFRNGRLCGTAALKTESVTTHPHLSPWLAALLVDPHVRRTGVGSRLIDDIEQLAAGRGHESIYCGTATADRLLERKGWEYLDRRPYFVSDVIVYRKSLVTTPGFVRPA